jgi:hypothetical protein
VNPQVNESEPGPPSSLADDQVRGLEVEVEDAVSVEEPEDVEGLEEEGDDGGDRFPPGPGGEVAAGDEIVGEPAPPVEPAKVARPLEVGV